MEGLRAKMLEQLPEVEDIHEFHVWRLVGDKVFASVHAMLRREVRRSDHMLNAKRIKVTECPQNGINLDDSNHDLNSGFYTLHRWGKAGKYL